MEKKENRETPPPLLLIEYGQRFHENQYCLYNVLENRWDTTRIPIFFDWTPLPCNYGWIVLLNPVTNNCSLWNPKSREIIQLPELRGSSIYNECVLSKPPNEVGCHILFKSAARVDLAFCQIGVDEFVEMSTSDIKDVDRVETLKFFRGNIYAVVGFVTTLVTISFVGKTLEFMPILDISPSLRLLRPWSSYVWYYLIDDDDDDDDGDDEEMLLVCQMFPAYYLCQFCDFYVFRIDINGLECEELLDIGQRTIFLSNTGNAFCRSSTGIKPNSIYYVFDERNVSIYNLDNRAITSLLPCFAGDRILKTTYWIEDSFS